MFSSYLLLLFKIIAPIIFLTSFTTAYEPTPNWGMGSTFIEGQALYIHGGTTSLNATPSNQTFSLDLSRRWTTSRPLFKLLAPGFRDYLFPSALMKGNATWFFVSNQTAYQYSILDDAWTTIGGSDVVSKAKGLGGATDPVSGLIYIVNGYASGKSVSMQQFNPAVNSINKMETDPMLADLVGFAVAWSTYLGGLLVHGGKISTRDSIQRYLYHYTPSIGWSLLQDTGELPTSRNGHCMVPAYGGTKIVLFGGFNGKGEALSDIYILDVSTLHWTKGTDGGLKVARAHTACAVTNDLFVSWGGSDSNSRPLTSNQTVVYNMKTGDWQDYYMPTATTRPTDDKPTVEPTSSQSEPSTSGMIWIIGGLVGGLVGGVAVAGSAAMYILYRKRHQHFPTSSSGDEHDKEFRYYHRGSDAGSHLEPLIGSLSPLAAPSFVTLPPSVLSLDDTRGDKYPQTLIHIASTVGAQEDDFRRYTVYRPSVLPPARNPQAMTEWIEGEPITARNPQSIPLEYSEYSPELHPTK